MQSKQYFTKIKNYPHEKSTEPQIAYFCGQYIKKKPLKKLYFSGFHDFSFCKGGATRNRN